MRRSLHIPLLALLLAACSPQAASTPIQPPPLVALDTPMPVTETPFSPTETAALVAPSAALSGEAEVEIEDFAFTPQVITVTVGTTVKWGNKDKVQHTVTGDDGTWGSGLLSKGEEFFFTFTQPGTFTYHCQPHPAMTGTVLVVTP